MAALVERFGPPRVARDDLVAWAISEPEAGGLFPGSSAEGSTPEPGLRW